MCFTLSNVRSPRSWNWEGDEIINDPIIRAARKIPDSERQYDIDIRSFLLAKGNAVLRRALNELLDKLPESERALFRSHVPGAFDLRVQRILEYVSTKVGYANRGRQFDAWLFPDETIAQGAGDCEDRAFLLASLLLTAGISGYVMRVVLGKLFNVDKNESKDHVWVMYKNEDGRWLCLEPLLMTKQAQRSSKRLQRRNTHTESDTFEYIPYFAFNDAHMWKITNNTIGATFTRYVENRDFWNGFDPEFATAVHNQLIDACLSELGWGNLNYVKAVSLAMDTVSRYDPRDHFDNGYIIEGWHLLKERMKSKSLNNLAYTVHSVADFYAHSSFAHFAEPDPTTGELPLFDPARLGYLNVNYASGDFDLNDSSRFSVNPKYYPASAPRKAAAHYATIKRVISGRFAQPADPQQGVLEKLLVYIPYDMRHAKDFPPRGGLPHHNEIAVDGPLTNGAVPADHTLYASAIEYERQFELRLDAAKRHITQLYTDWKRG